jgi:hypothetical protein
MTNNHIKKNAETLLFNKVCNSVREFAKRILVWFVDRNYYTARLFYIQKLKNSKKHYQNPPLLIYQMGKVGSSTIQRSLKALNLDRPIFHVHYLSKSRVEDLEKERRKYIRTEKFGLLKRPWMYQFLRQELIKRFEGQKWKIISLTRDPVARNMAAFFENLEFKKVSEQPKYEVKSDYYKIEPVILTGHDLEKLPILFFERFKHDSPLDFFDRELKSVFGIDVYSSEFPKSKGYKIYSGEKADAMIIKLEYLNQCVQLAFKEFIDVEDFNLINTNIGNQKDYAAVYSQFKDFIIFPKHYIDKMYQTKYMQHFYSDEEINQFRHKWFLSNEKNSMQGDG